MTRTILCPHGILGIKKCKDCEKEYHKEWRKNNSEYMKEWRRKNKKHIKKYKQKNREKKRKFDREYWQKNKERFRQRVKIYRQSDEMKKRDRQYANEYRQNNPEKIKAQNMVNNRKLPLASKCELCPEDDKQKASHKHHPDYNEPLIIISVCPECHYYVGEKL